MKLYKDIFLLLKFRTLLIYGMALVAPLTQGDASPEPAGNDAPNERSCFLSALMPPSLHPLINTGS